jgi:hypothetical protein
VTEHLTDGWEPDLPVADTLQRLWVGYEQDEPVCVGSLIVEAGVAAFSLGVTLVFSAMSRPGAEALGFLPICRFTLWHRPRVTS